jgi:hypothetical protein
MIIDTVSNVIRNPLSNLTEKINGMDQNLEKLSELIEQVDDKNLRTKMGLV